jgi:hypothetical protein
MSELRRRSPPVLIVDHIAAGLFITAVWTIRPGCDMINSVGVANMTQRTTDWSAS